MMIRMSPPMLMPMFMRPSSVDDETCPGWLPGIQTSYTATEDLVAA